MFNLISTFYPHLETAFKFPFDLQSSKQERPKHAFKNEKNLCKKTVFAASDNFVYGELVEL